MALQPEITALAQAVGADVKALLASVKAETTATLTGTTPVITPTAGTILTWTLSANSTPTLGTWTAGEGLMAQISCSTFTVTWPGAITWLTENGLAPDPSKFVGKVIVVVLYKIGSTVYGK